MKFFLIIFVLLVGSIIYAGNTFWTNHQFTIQAVAAFGTLAAVVLSLWLANRKYQPKNISVTAGIEDKPLRAEEKFYQKRQETQQKIVVLHISNFETFQIKIDEQFLSVFGQALGRCDQLDSSKKSGEEDEILRPTVNIPDNLLKKFPVLIESGDDEKFYVAELEAFKNLLSFKYSKMVWLKRTKMKLSFCLFNGISVLVSKRFKLKVILSAELKKVVKEAIRMSDK